MMPHDLPPWYTVYQQIQHWIAAGVFVAMVHDLCVLLRVAAVRTEQLLAAIFDGRTLQSTPESGEHSGFDGTQRMQECKNGSKAHMMVDIFSHLLPLHVMAANEQERQHVYKLAEQVQKVTGDTARVDKGDEGYIGVTAGQMAADRVLHGLRHHGI